MKIDASVQFIGPRKVLYGQATVGICGMVKLQDLGAMGAVGVHFIGHWCMHIWAKWTPKIAPIDDVIRSPSPTYLTQSCMWLALLDGDIHGINRWGRGVDALLSVSVVLGSQIV